MGAVGTRVKVLRKRVGMTDKGQQGLLLDALLHAAVDAIIVSDQRGQILRFNDAAQNMFGLGEDEALGSNLSILMPEPFRSHHDDYIRAHRDGVPPSIIGIGREIVGRRKSGETFPMHLSVGEIKGVGEAQYVGIIRDLSEEKATLDLVRELDSQLEHADRLVLLGELTAGIGHEINQPLTAIAAFSEAAVKILQRQALDSDNQLHTICERISEQARRAGDVVTRLRKLSYKGEATRTRHSLNALLEQVLLLLEHELKKADVELITHHDAELPEIYVDEIQIQQVLVNLIKNSLDALEGYSVKDGLITIHLERDGQHLEIRVADNGPGISKEIQPRLFEPFFTTKRTGVGLGLSICRNIAIAHGGTLTYRPGGNDNRGFCLRLPLEVIG